MTVSIYNNSSFTDTPYGLQLRQTFATAGTFSVTGIPAGTNRIYAVVIGGGGAGSAGTCAVQSSTGVPGNGGAGFLSSITGSRVFYAGGGGGGSNYAGLGSAGGGNGGAYSSTTIAQSAIANTGSGGGGGSVGSSSGAGSSGIVIIRYPANLAPPASVTGGPQVLYNNGYQIYVWTSSGTITF